MRAAFVAAAVVVGVTSVASANAAFPGRNGMIAFVAARGGNEGALYTIRADGTHLRRLTKPPPLPARDLAFSHDGRLLAFSRPRNPGYELWIANADGSQPRLLVRIDDAEPFEPAFSPDGRTIAFTVYNRTTKTYDLWRAGVDGRGRRPLLAGRGTQASADWSPDGRRIAYGGDRGVYVLDVRTGASRMLGPGGEPAWSPDGRRIASTGRYGVYVMRASGGPPRKIVRTTAASRLRSPAWSRDGRRLAVLGCCQEREGASGSLFGFVLTMRADGSDARRTLVADEAFSPAWTRDGRVVFADGVTAWVLDAAGGKPHRYFARGAQEVTNPAWSPDGRRLALVSVLAMRITTANGTGGVSVGEGLSPAWAPDGERIAFDNGTGGIDVVTIATREVDRILPDDGAGDVSKGYPAWSPRGDTIAYSYNEQDGSGTLAFYDVDARRSRVTKLAMHGAPDWRPDGGAVAYTAGTGIRVYDVRSRRSRLLVPNGSSPAWSPDGRRLVFVRSVGGSRKLFVAARDGTDVQQLTQGAGDDVEPTWQPLPRRPA